jgi:lysozyme
MGRDAARPILEQVTMKSRRQVSRKALELIERFEGYRAKAARLPDGRWTIGYGHTKTARKGAEVSESDAEALLIYDLLEITEAVSSSIFAPLSQNQFDALCAFAFNVGVDNFRQSVVLRRLNEGEPLRAAGALDLWRKAEFEGEHIVIDALVRRRAAEKALFLTPADGFTPAPTPLLRPELDEDMIDHSPREVVEILPSLEGEEVTARRGEPLALQLVEDAEPEPAAQYHPARGDGWTALKPDETVEPAAEPDAAGEPSPALAEGEHSSQPVADTPPPVEAFAPGAETESPADVPPAPERKPSALMWSWGLALAGAILFGVGLVWVYQGRASGSAPTGWGLALGIVGLVCLSTAGYFLLDRLGNRHDID